MNKATALGGAAFVLSAGLVVQQLVLQPAAPAPSAEIPPPSAPSDLSALQDKLRALEERVQTLEAEAQASAAQEKSRVAATPVEATQAPREGAPESSTPAAASSAPATASEPAAAPSADTKTAVLAAVDARIDEAVDEKLEEIKLKWNKKPKLETVAKLLELDERQAQVIEEEVRKGQNQIRSILDQPLADGSNLLDDLVEVMAHGQSPKAGQLWGTWLGRLQREKVPGTDLTYAQRLEQAKSEVRDGFRQVMSPDQYREFEEWAFDPTEVEGISESPWEAFGERVAARAAELAQQGQE